MVPPKTAHNTVLQYSTGGTRVPPRPHTIQCYSTALGGPWSPQDRTQYSATVQYWRDQDAPKTAHNTVLQYSTGGTMNKQWNNYIWKPCKTPNHSRSEWYQRP